MHIKVDSRESCQELFNAFDIFSWEKDMTYEKIFLEVGDVASGNVVIERKEAGDFVGSIMDGRLKEQAIKMTMNYDHRYVIIEGNPFRTQSAINPHAIIGKMTSLTIKYDIKLLFTDSPEQTAYACYSIFKKHEDGKTFDPKEFAKCIPKLSDDDIVTAMIYQTPRLGYDKARAISEKYGFSLRKLATEATVKDLTELPGVGKKSAERILELINK